MKKTFITSTLAALAIAATGAAQAAIISGPLTYGGNTYYQLSETDWDDAEFQAVGLGGHLVTINDAAEQAWLTTAFPVVAGWGNFIGLNDRDVEGTFTWISGEPVTYTNWDPGEPNNCCGGEDDVHMWWFNNSTWNDIGGGATANAIVEVRGTNVPDGGSTIALLGLAMTAVASFRRKFKV